MKNTFILSFKNIYVDTFTIAFYFFMKIWVTVVCLISAWRTLLFFCRLGWQVTNTLKFYLSGNVLNSPTFLNVWSIRSRTLGCLGMELWKHSNHVLLLAVAARLIIVIMNAGFGFLRLLWICRGRNENKAS